MKTLAKLLLLVCVISPVFSVMSCIVNKSYLTGGTSTEVIGKLFEPDGKEPAQGVSVVLRFHDSLPNFQNPYPGSPDSGIQSSVTDKEGIFHFTSVNVGIYTIVGNKDTSLFVLFDSVKIEPDKSDSPPSVYLPDDTLKPPKTIMGRIDRKKDSKDVYVVGMGLGVYAHVNKDGSFTLPHLPQGDLRLQFISLRDSSGSDTSEIVKTGIEAGNTVIDTFHLQWRISRFFLTVLDNGMGMVGGSDSVAQGDSQLVTATALSGYYFTVWRVISGTATIADSSSASTTVILEKGNATIQAIFRKIVTFQKTFGGADNDEGYSVQQASDGGYIIVGNTSSFGAGNDFVYLIKTDALGDTSWTKTFGSRGANNFGKSVQQTSDRGYIIAGYTSSSGLGNDDVYLIKTDTAGTTNWAKTFGGSASEDNGKSVQQTIDGGYIIAGYISPSYSVNGDVYLLKTDATGTKSWAKTFGGTASDEGSSVRQTTDKGYIIAGSTCSFGSGGSNVYLIKTDAAGDTIWTKIFDDVSAYASHCVQQTNDGGYIISGVTYASDSGSSEVYLIKTDAAGNALWTKTYGGYEGNSVEQTRDGGYIIAGSVKIQNTALSNMDVYLIKADATGNKIWTKTFGGADDDYGYSVQQTSDGGYIVTGTTSSSGAGGYDVYLIKTDENGNSTPP